MQNDKIQLAAMGEHLAEQQKPMCLQKRVEQLEALLREARPYVKYCYHWGGQHDVDLRDAIDEALGGAPITRLAVESLTRYKLAPEAHTLCHAYPAEMVEDDDGEYVLLDDVVTILAGAPSPDSAKLPS